MQRGDKRRPESRNGREGSGTANVVALNDYIVRSGKHRRRFFWGDPWAAAAGGGRVISLADYRG